MNKSLRFIAILLISISSLLSKAQTPDANNILYVNINIVGGAGTGNSWANAIPQLADALKFARTQNNYTSANPLKIYVAKGTYKPLYNAATNTLTSAIHRDNAFVMVNNVQIYGGFDPANNIDDLTDSRLLPSPSGGDGGGSILSGDIGTVGTATDNAYHVVVASGAVGTARLDGFTVTGGYSTSIDNGSVTINGTAVLRRDGGGMLICYSSPSIANCNFTSNTAYSGGGMYNGAASSLPIITNCNFTSNTATYGGGMYNSVASPRVSNCNFTANTGTTGGGMFSTISGSSPIITNCSFTANTVTGSGGGMYNGTSSSPTIINTTIANNGSSGFYNSSSTPVLLNCIVWDTPSGTAYTASYSLIKDKTDVTNGNINAAGLAANDIFTNPSGSDYTLKSYSPAINKGSNALFTGLSASTLDLAGNPRVYKYATSGIIDLGAYEYQSTDIVPDANNIVYVNLNATGDGSGSSWANAIPQLADALQWARIQNNFTSANPLKIYVAKGTYKPLYNATDGSYTTNGDRKNAFVMVNNVQIYGGFDPANNIDDLTDTRIFGASGSILSGDIGTTGTATDNTYHLVIASGSIGNALLDGFTIADGNADGNSTTTVGGAILHNNYGAGIYNYEASPVYKNLVVKNNQVEWDGAGMYNQNASPVISNVLFTSNYAQYKGTIINYSNSSPTLANVTITGNTSDYYSGIFNSGSTAYIYNSIIWDNKINGNAATAGADIANDGAGHAIVKNSITQSYTTGNIADNNLVNTNPLFTDAANGDYTLGTASPAINKGSNAYYTDADKGNGSLTDKDLSGNKRLVNSSIDMGAYENQTLQTEPDANNILYVNLSATGDGSGNTWANAIPQLADALKWARAKNSFTTANPLKIYVAKGTYKPLYNPVINALTSATDRDNAFVMVNNVQIYGGFDPATGIDDLTDTRIFGSGGSILSGDIGTVGTATDNTYHVVISSGAVGTASLDGFTVTAAYNVAANTGSVTVNSNSIFRNYGGAMHNYNSSPAIANCSFIANTAYDGGGMYNGSSSPSFTNCNFSANTATYGGGIYNYASSPSVINCSFTTNTALTSGGGMYNSASSPVITNCRFTANTVNYGGGMFNTSSSAPKLTNTTIANNGNYGFYNDGSGTPVLQNSIVWDVVMGTYTATYSLIKGVSSTLPNGNVSAGNLLISDIFKDYGNGDYSLAAMAPVINKGDNQLYWNAVGGSAPLPPLGEAGWGLDLAGNLRLFSSRIDMGAYESQISIPTPDANNILYVNASVSGGTGDGSSWENAIPQLADALKWARIQNKVNTTVFDTTPLKIYVAKGTYKPLYNAADGSYTTDGGRDNAFVMVKNVQLYGGFDPANNIDDLTDTRVIPSAAEGYPANGTVLSGDIGTVGVNTDNTYHVVISSGDVGSALLNGFTVIGGYTASSNIGNITVNGNIITRHYGGGMINRNSSPTIVNCSFTQNSADYGGGMFNNSSSSPAITNCHFKTNTANYGGAMCNNFSSPSITNCSFTDNTATYTGGGMHNSLSSSAVVNCSFTENSANYGGAMCNSSSPSAVTNTTIANNNGNAGLYTPAGTPPVLQNSIVWDTVIGSYTAKYSLIKDKTDTNDGNVNAGTLAATDIFTDYANGDYTLKSYSPAINKGDNALFTGLDANTKDLLGNPRVYNYATNGTIDLGAYEYQSVDIVPDANNIIYVNVAVTGGAGNGSSWANATINLADALKFARAKYDANNTVFDTTPLKIYVAKGTYKPLYNAADASYTTNGDRDNAFVMVKNVQIYGGFDLDNNIDDLTDTRSYTNTILSGDLDNSGTRNANDAYHVVMSSGAVGTALLDGFTVTGSYSTLSNTTSILVNNNVFYRYSGGGMYNVSSSPALVNCNFTGNTAYMAGGMYNNSSSPTVANCNFTANTANTAGGMYNNSPSSLPTITNCSFTANRATMLGGAMYNHVSSPIVTNCSFKSNVAGSYGGGMYNSYSYAIITSCSFTSNTATISGGGMYNNSSWPAIVNSIFTRNDALTNGGAIYGVQASPTITNTTIANNGSAGFYNGSSSTPVLQNSIIWDVVTGSYTAKYSLIKDKTNTSNGNINATGLATTDIFTNYAGGDYTLKASSPAVNKGSNTLFTGLEANTKDIVGNARVYNFSDGGTIDLGAYESTYSLTPVLSAFANISKTYGDADFTLTAPTSTSNGAFTYSSSDGNVAIIIGNAVSIVGAGTATITATQAATANYSGNTISLTLTVGKGSQTISFAALNPKTTSSADFALTATATSSLAVSYTSSNTAVAEVYQDGSVWKVKIKGEGNTNITAIQNGNGNYSAATDVVQQLIVIGAPLPVNLINFTAKAEGNYAKLQWQTTQEINSLQFSVYRKSEGNEFVKIGDVLAAINHQQLTINNYIFTDKTPLNGNNYYKLVQIDNNGTATELGIKTITFNLMPYTFNLFPNPTANQVTAIFTTGRFTQLQVVDVTGKVLKTKKIGMYDEGIIVDLSLFAKGTYLIKLLGKGESTSRKVVKQ